MADPQLAPPDLSSSYRSHSCGQLRAADAGTEVRLAGWVHRRRDHGQLIFLDLRDRHGITQVVIDRVDAPEAHASASRVRSEYVVAIVGTVAERLPGTENKKLATGDIEVRATQVTVLNESKTPPFYINDPDATIDETIRLKYRYLDLRRPELQANIVTVWLPAGAVAPAALLGAQAGVVASGLDKLDAELSAEAEATAGQGASIAREAGLAATSAAPRAEGNVWATLVHLAARERPAAIVLGSHGRSGAAEALLGSVSHGVAHHSSVPVLVVPPGP